MVAVHPADQRRHVAAPVAVAARRVVHVHLLDGAVVRHRAVAPRLLRAPVPAAADVRSRHPPRAARAGERLVVEVRGLVAGLLPRLQQHQGQPAGTHSPGPHLDTVRRADPHQLGAGPRGVLARPRVGPVGQGGHREPVGPLLVRAGADLQDGIRLAHVPGQGEHRVRRGREAAGLPRAVVGAPQQRAEVHLELADAVGALARERQRGSAGAARGLGSRPDAGGDADGAHGGRAAEGSLQHRSPARRWLVHPSFIAHRTRWLRETPRETRRVDTESHP